MTAPPKCAHLALDQVRRAGGLCVAAHPHAPYPGGEFAAIRGGRSWIAGSADVQLSFRVSAAGRGTVEWRTSAEPPAFVRVEVRHPGGHAAALTNPVLLA